MSNVVTHADVAKRDMTERVPDQKVSVSFGQALPNKAKETPVSGRKHQVWRGLG